MFAAPGETQITIPTPLSLRQTPTPTPTPNENESNRNERLDSEEAVRPNPVWRDFNADHPLNSEVNNNIQNASPAYKNYMSEFNP